MPLVFVSRLFHETHCFVDDVTTVSQFSALQVFSVADVQHDSSPLGGAVATLRELGWQVLPGPDYSATPSGVVRQDVFEAYWEDFQRSWNPEVEAIFLVLHGAMVTEHLTDVEGELLRRVRTLPHANQLPIYGVIDLHANFSAKMACYANGLLAYQENPHADAWQTARRAAQMLHAAFIEGEQLVTSHRHSGLLLAPIATATSEEPMRSLLKLARSLEAGESSVAGINISGGFSFADTPDTGLSFQVIGSAAAPRVELLDCLCHRAEQLRDTVQTTELPLEQVMKTLRIDAGSDLNVLVEVSDNIGGGAPGDMTYVLRALVEHDIPRSAICISDPTAVRRLELVPIREKVRLEIGGKGSRYDLGPLPLEVTLVSQSDGRFELEDKHSHLASMVGDHFEMGPCAVVRHRGLEILLTSKKTPPFDLGQWRSQGIEPTEKSVVVVKAAVAHRRAYDILAPRYFPVDTPGPCRSDLSQFEYRHAKTGSATAPAGN